MKEAIKWTINHMPKSDDKQLDVMSLPNVAKARFFHSSFPQYTITTPSRCWAAPLPWRGTSPRRWVGTYPR